MQPPTQPMTFVPLHVTSSAGELRVAPAADPAVCVPCPTTTSTSNPSAGNQGAGSPNVEVKVDPWELGRESDLIRLMYWIICGGGIGDRGWQGGCLFGMAACSLGI